MFTLKKSDFNSHMVQFHLGPTLRMYNVFST